MKNYWGEINKEILELHNFDPLRDITSPTFYVYIISRIGDSCELTSVLVYRYKFKYYSYKEMEEKYPEYLV